MGSGHLGEGARQLCLGVPHCMLGLVCFHVLDKELSSYYGLTWSKATGDTNCRELLMVIYEDEDESAEQSN